MVLAPHIPSETSPKVLENTEIQKILAHRYPFLLVDRIIDYEPGVRAVGIKNVTINEPHFQGHFPTRPLMPGALESSAASCQLPWAKFPSSSVSTKPDFAAKSFLATKW
jgi:hypothetical protein